MKPSTAVAFVVLLLGAAGCASYPGADVPFLVTPHEIVDQMLRLARVGPADTVYEEALACAGQFRNAASYAVRAAK